MNEEAIKLKLESYCEWCISQGGDCHAKLEGCAIADILALLHDEPTMHTPCAGESGGVHPRPTFRKPKEPKSDELVTETILALTNGVGEKPYFRREDESVKVFVADDCLLCTIPPFADAVDEYELPTQIAVAICEAGQLLQKQAEQIAELKADKEAE